MTHEEQLVRAFVDGAKWWEFVKTNATMWQSDQREAFVEATKRLREGILPARIWTIIDAARKGEQDA